MLAIEMNKNFVEHSNHFLFPLHIAASSGLVDLCQYMLASTDEETTKDYSGQIPFHIAAKNGHYKICKQMLLKSKVVVFLRR